MKKIFFIATLIIVGGLPWSSQARTDSYADTYSDSIDSYDVQITVQPDSSLDITETIKYYFGDPIPAHGIERSIPTTYSNGLFNDAITLDLKSITDDKGDDWPVEESHNGSYLVWRIGSSAAPVTGLQTYQLHYTAKWAMTAYNGNAYSELYWDAIGTEWSVPVENVYITVVVPPNSQLEKYPAQCYYGAYGDNKTCTFTEVDNRFVTTLEQLQPYEGVSVLFAFNPASVKTPTTIEQYWHWVTTNWSLFLIPVWIVIGLACWLLNRRIRPSKPLIPIYEIPEGITSPAMAEYLLKGKLSPKAVAAELIESARVGELEFVYDPDKGEVKTLRSTGKSVRTDAPAVLLRTLLFAQSQEVELKKTTLASSGFMVSAKQYGDAAIKLNGWLNGFKKAMKTCGGLYGIGGLVIGGLMISTGNNSGAHHLIVTGVTFLVFGFAIFFLQGSHLPLNTAGADARRLLEGFKWFLSVTETERLKFNQVPKLTPKLFETYLPYAIVFGVEKQWVKQFEHILTEPPTWMHGANQAMLYSALLSTGRTPTQFKVPVSARSGGSGFSGGGFSGGGFGGGGGGRW